MARIVIFGATSAIAAAAARQWVAAGDSLFLIGRNPNKLEAIVTDLNVRKGAAQIVAGTSADLNESDRHAALIEEARAALGGIDVALIAHGSLPDQAACAASVTATLAELNTNALSVIAILTLIANAFERDRAGVIAVIGSVAGDRGRQSNYVYGAAKGMIAIFLQGLRNRLSSSGVAVLTIKPGFVDTPMTASIERKGALWARPEDVAKGIVTAVARRRDVVYLPGFWRLIMLVIRHVPERVFKRMKL